jgi:DNA recombination protein RmuC
MSEFVIAVVAAAVAAVVVALLLRRPAPAAADPEMQALRSEVSTLRETTQQSIAAITQAFGTQIGSLAQNVQTAMAAVNSNVADRLDAINKNVAERLEANVKAMGETTNAVSSRIASVQQTFASLQKQVGEMGEQARQLGDLSKSIEALERVFSGSKLKGGFGEAQLESLLAQVFPREQYEMQHRFLSGEIADAVLFFAPGKVVIDSKFPLASFRRIADTVEEEQKAARREFLKEVRKQVDDIAAKYIRPAEGTLPFALMYVPAESVYYEAIVRDEDGNDLYQHCLDKRVMPVSPNSLYAYLHTIVVGLNSLRVSQRAEDILRDIASLNVELGRFDDAFEKVGTHLRNAQKQYEESDKHLDRLENRVRGLASNGVEQLSLEEPRQKAIGAGE